MAKCTECGADDVVAEAMFCHKCGARIQKPDDSDLDTTEVKLSPPKYAMDEDEREEAPAPSRHLSSAGAAGSSPSAVGGGKQEVEHDIWTVQFSPRGMIGSWILVGIICSICIVVAIMFPVIGWLWMLAVMAVVVIGQQCRYWYWRMNHRYRLTSYRLLEETGIISRTVNRIELIDIEDLQVVRTLVDRMVGIGSIVLLTHDVSDPKLTIRAVENVDQRYDDLEQAVRKEKRRREFRLEQS